MAGKKHNIGRHITNEDRQQNPYLNKYINSETLCKLLFKKTDRSPFPATSDLVDCKWCLKIMEREAKNG